jgi:hypothetical protein
MTGSFDAMQLDSLTGDELYRLLAAEMTPWTKEDGIAALSHQLLAPLAPDLLAVPGMTPSRLKALLEEDSSTRSFLDELVCEHPSAGVLEAIKEFGRHFRHLPESPLCGHPAAVIYYAAIAAALVRLDSRISSLSPSELQRAFTWAAAHEGATSLSPVFRSALSRLG